MTDTIDPTEWLHQSVDKAYPELMRQVGAAVNEHGKIACTTPFIFDALYNIRIKLEPCGPHESVFNAAHLSSAEFLYTLHDVAFKHIGYSRMKEMMRDILTAKGGDNKFDMQCAGKLYIMIMRDLNAGQAHMVKRICFEPMRPRDIGWAVLCYRSIRGAFDKLGQAIENSLDNTRAIQEDVIIRKAQLSPKLTLVEPVSGN